MNKNINFFRKYFQIGRIGRSLCTRLEPNENQPIKFSTSPASRKTAIPVLNPKRNDMPWYQPYSVIASVSVFLIYFCMLREENDVDLEFTLTLYDRIKGLEKEQLIQSYKYNVEHGKDVSEIEKKLKELEAKENKEVA